MEEVRDEWGGVSGQISTVRKEVIVVKQELARAEQKVEQKMDAMAAEIKEVKAEMAANQELIMEQLWSMAQQKADS